MQKGRKKEGNSAKCNMALAGFIQGPPMDWTEDAGMYKRFCEYKESVQYMLAGPLNKESKTAKANYLMSWLAQSARNHLKGVGNDLKDADTILKDLETWCRPKANAIASFRDLTNLKQDSLSLSEQNT